MLNRSLPFRCRTSWVLSYLVKCCLKGKLYKVYGYKGKQVRDNIHSSDLVNMIWEFIKKPSRGEVYNVGGYKK